VGEVLAAAGVLWPRGDSLSRPPRIADPATPIAIDAAEVTVLTLDSARTYRTADDSRRLPARIGLSLPPGGAPAGRRARHRAETQPLPQHTAVDPYKTIIIEDGANRRALRTTALTVAEALAEAGAGLAALDTVTPSRETALTPDLTIVISRAAPYRITADGQTVEAHSGATAVGQVLADNGIALGPLDYTRPPLDATIAPGGALEVVRVTERIDTGTWSSASRRS
jgi:hypothetical protein